MRTTARGVVRIALAASLVFWIVIALRPPRRMTPLPADAPAARFSAGRAMRTVEAIAQKPHPPGSPEHARVQGWILAELAALGLEPDVQSGTVSHRSRSSFVQNIVTRLPGLMNTRPIMLVAHYDSVPTGPGAADDAHGVAVLLEIARALRATPRLRNDVIFLFTDGEERGLLGAELFMRAHPWRNEPGVVINFEARGAGGVPAMFETSEGNAWLIRHLRAAAPDVSATSLAFEIYRRMPNGTDLSVFKQGGLAGLNFAFIDRPELYHHHLDDPAHLDQSSLQESGTCALALTRRLGYADLRLPPPGNAVYFPAPWLGLVCYPASWVLPLAVLSAIALGLTMVFGYRRHARGVWLGWLLVPALVLLVTASRSVPGVTYLLQWPLAAGIAALALLLTSQEELGAGWRAAALVLLSGVATLILLPPLPAIRVALGTRTALPMIVAAALLLAACIAPQLVLLARRKRI